MADTSSFDSALYGVCGRLKRILCFLPEETKAKTDEIRLRSGLPLALTADGQTLFLKPDGQTCRETSLPLITISKDDLEESFRLLCDNSVYAHTSELENGYIMLRSGCRAGVCGTITENGYMQDISSINIRIAREVYGAADALLSHYKGGFLIAGPPGSGKTTVLRDMIRQLSGEERLMRVAVIDNRGELSGSYLGEASCDLGKNCDILIINNKAKGIEIATRTMNPQILAFDEIATVAELEKVIESFFSGVDIITTAHIGNVNELMTRTVTKKLLQSGAISTVAVLPKNRAKKAAVYDVKEILSGTYT